MLGKIQKKTLEAKDNTAASKPLPTKSEKQRFPGRQGTYMSPSALIPLLPPQDLISIELSHRSLRYGHDKPSSPTIQPVQALIFDARLRGRVILPRAG